MGSPEGGAESLIDPDSARRVADAFGAAGFTIDGIRSAYGPAVLATLSSGDAVSRAARRGLRQDGSALAGLVRLLLLGEWLDADQLVDLLPADAAPLLVRDGGRVRCPWEIAPHGDETHDWWVVSDRTDPAGRPLRHDHVLGVGGAATTLAQLTVRRQVARALDLGTGCGVQALHLSTHADRVTATDLVPRALRLAATSAALSGVELEFVQGDLVEPVAGREFDLVVCNPPFVLGPATSFAYRDSALAADADEAGDDFCRQVLRSCAGVLAPGGVAQTLGDWLHVRGEDWRDRVAAWVGDLGCDAWLIERELVDPVDYVRTWLTDAGQGDDSELAAAWLDWFAARDVEAVGFGWVALRRGESPHRIAVEQWRQPVDQPLGTEVDGWLQRTEWLRRHADDALLDHAFRSHPAARLDVASSPSASGWEPIAQSLTLDAGFRWSLPTDAMTAAVVAGCDGERSLATLVTVLQLSRPDVPPGELSAAACAAVRGLIDRGLLLP